jgi:hypothetical protein
LSEGALPMVTFTGIISALPPPVGVSVTVPMAELTPDGSSAGCTLMVRLTGEPGDTVELKGFTESQLPVLEAVAVNATALVVDVTLTVWFTGVVVPAGIFTFTGVGIALSTEFPPPLVP